MCYMYLFKPPMFLYVILLGCSKSAKANIVCMLTDLLHMLGMIMMYFIDFWFACFHENIHLKWLCDLNKSDEAQLAFVISGEHYWTIHKRPSYEPVS